MKHRSKFAKLLVLALCLVLAVFMTVEIAHMHGPSESAHCQLCACAHIAIETQPAWLTAYVLHLIGVVAPGELLTGSSPIVVTAFIRPPPVSL